MIYFIQSAYLNAQDLRMTNPFITGVRCADSNGQNHLHVLTIHRQNERITISSRPSSVIFGYVPNVKPVTFKAHAKECISI